MDFSTDFFLDRVQNGVQALAVRYTAPMLDENGRQVMQKLVDGRVVPAMTQYESSVAPLRTSQRAILRPAGSPPGSDEHSLWKGNSMRVRAAK